MRIAARDGVLDFSLVDQVACGCSRCILSGLPKGTAFSSVCAAASVSDQGGPGQLPGAACCR
jgi:hypothetical protein